MFLAMIGLAIDDGLARLNALKQTMSLVTNVTAALVFAVAAPVVWPAALAVGAGALAGGAAGGRLASLVRPSILRWLIIAIGLALAAVFVFRD
jgi:uncharacterized protein